MLETKYDFEFDRIVNEIKNAKTVLIQLPDGLKPYFKEIVDYLEARTKASIFIWEGSCFGACDIPNANFDLLVQFGHNSYL
ncbi:MAG TPA: diphthamide synthesis protein [Candidatus Nanoarchaeia archaeon]|nr:diphthamide synthesis protein [Candidatus Nanoarchaeia archaeon]